VGLLVGLGTTIATDWALLSLEEAVNRDEFRASLLAAIEEARAEALESLSPAAEETPKPQAALRPKDAFGSRLFSKRFLTPAIYDTSLISEALTLDHAYSLAATR
jgi:hypothetical protein